MSPRPRKQELEERFKEQFYFIVDNNDKRKEKEILAFIKQELREQALEIIGDIPDDNFQRFDKLGNWQETIYLSELKKQLTKKYAKE